MSESFTFELPGPPQPKGRARSYLRDDGKIGHVTPKATRLYERSIGENANWAKGREWRLDGVFQVDVKAYFTDYRKRDEDNITKAVRDGMNKIAYRDDSQVRKSSGEIFYGCDRACTVVTVTRLGDEPERKRRRWKTR